MNYLTDTKNLVRNSYLDSNKYLFTDRANTSAGPDKTGFSKMLAQAQAQSGVNTSSNQSASILSANAPTVSIKAGDTLTNIVKGHYAGQGQTVNSSDAMHLAQILAKSNGIQNADKIFPGQQLNLGALSGNGGNTGATASIGNASTTLPSQQLAATPSGLTSQPTNYNAATSLNNGSPARGYAVAQNGSFPVNGFVPQGSSAQAQASRSVVRPQSYAGQDAAENPILNKTLDRAVDKGFIPVQEKSAVYDKIVNMSKTYQFHPDDFARLTLMESDGMNPKATNNRCHGIIQFCDGPDRGAASAGFASNPKEITNHSVLKQLDLVSKYFDETGLKNFGPANLDDLYLTVLTPAARSETRSNANLNIAGSQASMLHVNRDTSAPITRHSIVEGLHQNAINRLGLDLSSTSVAQSSSTSANSNLFAGVQNNNTLSSRSQALINAQNSMAMNAASGFGQNQFQGLGQGQGQGQGPQNIQMMQATLLAQANQNSTTLQRGPNPLQNSAQNTEQNILRDQGAQIEQVQYNPFNTLNTSSTSNASTQRAQSLRVSAYLNQTYLP